MSVSHAYFYSFRIIFTFQRSLPAVLDIITQDSERLFLNENLEERRLFYVSSFEKTETGYDVVLEFETSRIDGQKIEVKYSAGRYEFGWR